VVAYPPSTAAGIPYVTVSPTGLAAGEAINNGAEFGPDTAGTTTCGIQEALNSLPAVTITDGGGNTVTGQSGWVQLDRGVFQTTTAITIPAGQIILSGAGASSYIPDMTIASSAADIGGTAIVAATYTQSAVTCPQDAHSQPATVLYLRDMDIRMTSPGSVQSSSAPDVLDLSGQMGGEVANVNVLEVKAAGGIGTNMYIMADFDPNAAKDDIILRNIRGYGGHTGVRINQAHVHATNISGGHTGNGIDAFACGIQVNQNLECYFANLHCFNTKYGLSFYPYGFADQPWGPQVIHGVHFEAVTHYLLNAANSVTGTLILDQPVWDQASPVPSTDVAAVLAAGSCTPSISAQTGIAVITSNEIDVHGLGAGRHVTVPAGSWTAGTSPYTFAALPYDAVWVLTTVGGMTALTLDGQALFNASFAVGNMIYVAAGHSLVATWATTAPVFQVLPV
jgi:hypothetical protein